MNAVEFSKKDRRRFVRLMESSLHELDSHAGIGLVPSPSRYPCREFNGAVSICMPWPEGVSDECPLHGELPSKSGNDFCEVHVWPPPNMFEIDTKRELLPFVEAFDEKILERIERFGVRDYAGDDWRDPVLESIHLLRLLPPLFPGERDGEFYAQYGRWMTEREASRFEEEAGHPPFTDESWIQTRYAGIRLCRKFVLRPTGVVANAC